MTAGLKETQIRVWDIETMERAKITIPSWCGQGSPHTDIFTPVPKAIKEYFDALLHRPVVVKAKVNVFSTDRENLVIEKWELT